MRACAKVLCMISILVMPHNCCLLKTIFIFTMGSLLWAVPLWRNSLVFHDVDKVRRIFLFHLSPPFPPCPPQKKQKKKATPCLAFFSAASEKRAAAAVPQESLLISGRGSRPCFSYRTDFRCRTFLFLFKQPGGG